MGFDGFAVDRHGAGATIGPGVLLVGLDGGQQVVALETRPDPVQRCAGVVQVVVVGANLVLDVIQTASQGVQTVLFELPVNLRTGLSVSPCWDHVRPVGSH